MYGVLRVSEQMEDAGMDISKHGGTAYNYGSDILNPPTGMINHGNGTTQQRRPSPGMSVMPAAK